MIQVNDCFGVILFPAETGYGKSKPKRIDKVDTCRETPACMSGFIERKENS